MHLGRTLATCSSAAMKFFALIALPLPAFSLPATAADTVETADWQWSGAAESAASLHTERSGNRIRFDLELNRGAPSYNSGIASGEFTLNDYLGIYQTPDYPKCVLVFVFLEDAVQIGQVGSGADCGFGYGVMARQVLRRK